MRIKVLGDCPTAAILRGYLQSNDYHLLDRSDDAPGDYEVTVSEAPNMKWPMVEGIESPLMLAVTKRLAALTPAGAMVLVYKGHLYGDRSIGVTVTMNEAERVSGARAVLRAINDLRKVREKMTIKPRPWWKRVMWVGVLTLLPSLAQAQPVYWPVKFVTSTGAVVWAGDGVNNAVRVNVVAGASGGGAVTQSTGAGAATNYWNMRLTDGTSFYKALTDTELRASAVNVNCASGCVAGGSFADAAAFAFGTTPVGLTAFVVDDVGTNTVAENSAGAGRMNTNRIPYFDLSKSAANTAAFLVTGTGGTFPVTSAGLTNLDVALSTRLKPADTLTGITTLGTITNVVHVDDNAGSLTIDNANLDAALSTRLKSADTLAGVTLVTTVGTITNPVTVAQATAANLNVRPDTSGATGSAVPARADYIGLSDGTNEVGSKAASAANLATALISGVQLNAPAATWCVQHTPAAATKATISQGAGAAGVRHYALFYSACFAAGATAGPVQTFAIRDGATGAGTVKWAGALAVPVNGSTCSQGPVGILGTAATAMTIEFAAAGAATTIETVSLCGMDVN